MSLYDHKSVGGILLVAGTAIGAGMLALPITTSPGGFYNAILLFLGCFLFMLLTLFLLLEANLCEKNLEANIISMARKHLGPFGAITAWLSFLLLLYAVAAAYMSAGGSLVGQLIFHEGDAASDSQYGIYLFTLVFAIIVYFGAWLVDYINRFLMIGLMGSYLSLVIFVTPHVKIANLSTGHAKYLFAALPIVVLSFTSHIIVPSLRTYLNNNVSQLKKVLLYGSLVPLLFYLIWEFNILGVLPNDGQFGIEAVAKGPHPVAGLIEALHKRLGLTWVAGAFGAFSFFALVTSFQAVMLSLIDFLSDGLQVKKTRWGTLRLLIFTVIPPLLFAVYFPSGFVTALNYAGVFVAILYGILPPLMLWKLRYRDKIDHDFVVPGGKPVLILTIILSLFVIFFQVAATMKWLPALN